MMTFLRGIAGVFFVLGGVVGFTHFFGGALPITSAAGEWDIAQGRFFTQTAEGALPGYGYAVIDDQVAGFWTEFQRLGGVSVVGYPVSRRYICDGYICQAFQKMILRWEGHEGRVSVVSVFEQLSALGYDQLIDMDWMVPNTSAFNERGLDWNTVAGRRLRLLDREEDFRQFFFGVSDDWIRFHGLPLGPIAEYEAVRVLRTQKTVLQQWRMDTPWAKAGEVILANGGLLAREYGLIPEESLRFEAGIDYLRAPMAGPSEGEA